MKLFGFYNGTYWMIISNLKEIDGVRVNVLESGLQHMRNELEAGRYVFVNNAGGWHTGDLEDKHLLMASDVFPTVNDALRIQKANLEVRKDNYCERKGITREQLEQELAELRC